MLDLNFQMNTQEGPILEGIIYKAFGQCIVFRGVAEIAKLAKISEKPDAYQRNINDVHLKEIITFLDKGTYKYFPEITLAYRVEDYLSFLKKIEKKLEEKNIDQVNNLADFAGPLSGKLVISNEYIPVGSNRARHAQLVINNKLKRLDGNHRLSPFDKLPTNPIWMGFKQTEIGKTLVSYCIIFTNNDDANKFEASIFNNVNFKQLPLKQEKIFKIYINIFLNRMS